MPGERRIEKLNILIREELSKIIDRDMEFPEGTIATLTRVAISPDRHYATVFFTVYGNKRREVLEMLSKNVYNIQQALNRRIKMRPVPRIHFTVDELEERRESVEKSLSDLKKKHEI